MTASNFLSRRQFSWLVAGAAAGVAAVPMLSTRQAFAQSQDSAQDLEALLKNRVLGDPDAPVTIDEYSSLTCPHCRAFHEGALPPLKENYIDTGKVKLVMHDFPLDGAAAAAAMMARCAPEERYFPVIEALFDQQAEWSRADNVLESLAQIGRFAGMSPDTLQSCFANEALFNALRERRDAYSEQRGISSTPTFFVGDEKIVGAQPYETFVAAIEAQMT